MIATVVQLVVLGLLVLLAIVVAVVEWTVSQARGRHR